ncbi:MAG TPA: DM13 domain-containing protein [Terriglobales bacterium]|nr:DM13 domain-containing protein [Terriglobales bacterium]
MNTRKIVIIVVAVVVLIGLWAAFRPERLWVNKTVNESFPTTSASAAGMPQTDNAQQVLATGRFHSVAHDGAGVATVYKLADGKRVLRLSEFSTSNGPALYVYLVAAADATDSDTVKKAAFVDLGPLKGNKGDQNYDLPADADLAKYQSVTVWCKRFNRNFTTAPLKEGMTPASPAAMNGPTPLAAGNFHTVLHETKGTATIYQLPDGKRVLRFTDFATSNGPDLQVYLVAAGDASDSDAVKKAGFVTLGALKGNQGDQNYEVPGNVDLAKYRAVTVWCRRFSANFATAPLTPKQG